MHTRYIRQNIKTWFNILDIAVSLNGIRQYIFYLSNLDVYRFIEYSNVLNLLEDVEHKDTILDLGAGYSISSLIYHDSIALDINMKGCKWQRKNGVKSVIADMSNMPISSNSIDVIVAISSIEHVPNDRRVYAEINRILKDNGCLIISVPYSIKESYVIRGLRRGIAAKLLNFRYLEKFWEVLLSRDNFYYFKEQTKNDFLNKVYGKDELLSIIKEENWIIEKQVIFGKKPFRCFFKLFPPGWFVLKDLIFGYIFHKIDTVLENNDGNTILLKLVKGEYNGD